MNLRSRIAEMMAREGLTGTNLITPFIARRKLPLQHLVHIMAEMVILQDHTWMLAWELTSKQVADWVNAISKVGMATGWRFGKAPYIKERPPPAVSRWSPFFEMSELFFRPDATRERLLLAIE